MEVWIETADVVDINDRLFRGAGSGIPATGYPRGLSKGIPAHFKGDAKGWFKDPGGKGRYVTGADLPRLIYVRWQSIAEPQTYEAYIEIPQFARNTMLKDEKAFCGAVGKWKTDYRKLLIVGLAPGGVAKVWLGGPCLQSTEVTPCPRHDQSRRPIQGSVRRHLLPPFGGVQSLHRQIRHSIWKLVGCICWWSESWIIWMNPRWRRFSPSNKAKSANSPSSKQPRLAYSSPSGFFSSRCPAHSWGHKNQHSYLPCFRNTCRTRPVWSPWA